MTLNLAVDWNQPNKYIVSIESMDIKLGLNYHFKDTNNLCASKFRKSWAITFSQALKRYILSD